MKDYIRSSDLCKYFSVSRETISNWVTLGKLKAYETLGGHYRFSRVELIDFIKKNKFKMPDELKPENGIPAGKYRILIVDDNEILVNIFKSALEGMEESFEVETASDGFEAGYKLSRFSPHLVILDFLMPGLNGNEVCKLIRGNEIHKGTKILGFTAYDEGVDELRKAGADKVIKKMSEESDLNIIHREICKLLGMKSVKDANTRK